MKSVGALMNSEHGTGLDKPGCAGDSKSLCNIDECVVKECYYCSFNSPMLGCNWECSPGNSY